MGTRPTQSTKVRHTPRRSVPRYVSPFVGARYPVQSGQVGAGWTAQRLYPGISLPSPGVRRTFHHPVGSGVPVEARPGFGSKDILLFFFSRVSQALRTPLHSAPPRELCCELCAVSVSSSPDPRATAGDSVPRVGSRANARVCSVCVRVARPRHARRCA